MSTTVMQAYRFALDPSPSQARDLRRHCGAARFTFNWALGAVKSNLEHRAAEKSRGLVGEELTPALDWSLPALRRAWNAAKSEVAPWWSECSKESFNTGLDGVVRSLKHWRDSKSGARAGRSVRFPRFRSRRRTIPACRFTTGVIRLEGRTHVVLPRLGSIKTHESTRKLARRIEVGTARIVSSTVREVAGRWYCSFTVEVQRVGRIPVQQADVVGVDLGISTLAVLSTGECLPNPRHLNRSLRTLRAVSRDLSRRQGPDRRTGQRASARWERARARVASAHQRVANLRKDGLHKLTSSLAATYGTVVIEDLNVAGMLRNRKLARHIADAGFSEIRRQLRYKIDWNGGALVIANRWFPSSKLCSACGVVKPKLRLSTRVFTCEHCGVVLDRDHNAAINLKQYVAQSGWSTKTGRGADVRPPHAVAVGREASTLHRPRRRAGQTGTFDQKWANH